MFWWTVIGWVIHRDGLRKIFVYYKHRIGLVDEPRCLYFWVWQTWPLHMLTCAWQSRHIVKPVQEPITRVHVAIENQLWWEAVGKEEQWILQLLLHYKIALLWPTPQLCITNSHWTSDANCAPCWHLSLVSGPVNCCIYPTMPDTAFLQQTHKLYGL